MLNKYIKNKTNTFKTDKYNKNKDKNNIQYSEKYNKIETKT